MRALVVAALVLAGLPTGAEPVERKSLLALVDAQTLILEVDGSSRWFALLEDTAATTTQLRRTRMLRNDGALFVGAAIAIRPGPLSLPVSPSLRLGYERIAYDLPLPIRPDRLLEEIGLVGR